MSEQLSEKYYDWMCSLIKNNEKNPVIYSRILKFLYTTEFTWLIDLDGNRADDGIELRYRFGCEAGIENTIIHNELDNRACSVLEMLVALSLRCEDDIMQSTEERRVDKWFWVMMDNLGFSLLENCRYDVRKANTIVKRLLDRTYGPDGTNGLVTIPNCEYDLRYVDIWYQMMWYLTYISKGV